MNSVETIKLAKLRLAQLGCTAEVIKARYNSGARQVLAQEDPTKTPHYFEYVSTLISIISQARYAVRGYRSEQPTGRILQLQVSKRFKDIKQCLAKRGFRMSFTCVEDKLLVSVHAQKGKKHVTLNEPLHTKFVLADEGLVISREIVQQSSQGSIYLARYACLKTMTVKTGTFAEGVDGKLTRCAGLPSAKKHLVDVITRTYARAM